MTLQDQLNINIDRRKLEKLVEDGIISQYELDDADIEIEGLRNE